MLILNKLMILISFVLLLLCILAPMRRKLVTGKSSFVQKLLRPHTFYGILLFITSFIHGILSGKKPGMMTGKLAWLCLLLLLCFSALKGKMGKERWIRIHRGCTVCFCVLVAVHIMYALLS